MEWGCRLCLLWAESFLHTCALYSTPQELAARHVCCIPSDTQELPDAPRSGAVSGVARLDLLGPRDWTLLDIVHIVNTIHLQFSTGEGSLPVVSPRDSFATISGLCLPPESACTPRLSPCSLSTWNVRSMFSNVHTCGYSTVHYAKSLINSHTFAFFAETLSSIAGVSAISPPLEASHAYFWGHKDHDSGGVCLAVDYRFLESCSAVGCCVLEGDSRVVYFWSDSEFGALDIFGTYLDPSDQRAQVDALRVIRKHVRPGAHTLLAGDWNFVMQDLDRVNDDHVQGTLQSPARKFFQENFADFLEFEQPLYTCRYVGAGGGCSKLDRTYTSLNSLALSSIGTACNLLEVHHSISDHAPVSTRFFDKFNQSNIIHDHTIQDADFHDAMVERLQASGLKLGEDGGIAEGDCVCGFVEGWLDAARKAGSDIRKRRRAVPPTATQHKLLLVASLFRALRDSDRDLYDRIYRQYPEAPLVPFLEWSGSEGYVLLNNHYVELVCRLTLERSRCEAKGDGIDTEEGADDGADNFVEFGGLGSAFSSVYKLRPGGHSSVSALQDPMASSEGDDIGTPSPTPRYTTDPVRIARVLNSEWSNQFSEFQGDVDSIPEFFADVHGKFSCSLEEVLPSEDDCACAIDGSGNCACGPDGVPYSFFRKYKAATIEIIMLLLSFLFLGDPNAMLPDFLVAAFLVFLPKKSFSRLPNGLRLYSAKSLRPITLSNSIIKLVAAAMKISLGRVVSGSIHWSQRCLHGRFLLDNVLLIDDAMHRLAVASGHVAGGVLLDMAVAFPSVAHNFLFAILLFLGFPVEFVTAITKLYFRNFQFIRIGGKVHPGPTLLRGVRQGCPLSMLLFAIILDGLLVKFEKVLSPEDVMGAFADDLGFVFSNVASTLPVVLGILAVFSRITGLFLNLGKCVIILLGDDDSLNGVTQQLVISSAPATAQFQWKDHGEYLGFLLGPGAVGHEWDGPIRKATDVTLKWAHVKCGFFFHIIACNVFILSMLGYIMQLVPTNCQVKKILDFMVRKIFVGPGNGISLKTVCSLDLAGFKVSLRDLFAASIASKVRVAERSSLDLEFMSAENYLARNAYLLNQGEQGKHYTWHLNSMVSSVALARAGVTSEFDIGQSDFVSILHGTPKDRLLQRRITKALGRHGAPARKVHFTEMLRKRLTRFNRNGRLGVPIGRLVTRALKRLEDLSSRVQPSILSSYFKVLVNAWPTARRMRSLQGAKRAPRCLLCGDGNDSIEHLAHCTFCAIVFSKFNVHCSSLLEFLALDSSTLVPFVLVARTKAVHVIFQIRSIISHSPVQSAPSPGAILSALLSRR